MYIFDKNKLFLAISIINLLTNSISAQSISYTHNIYNDVVARVSGMPESEYAFEQELMADATLWQQEGYKAVWFTIPTEYALCIPAALRQQYTYHHTTSRDVVMTRELKEVAESTLPDYATHTVGVAGLVLDDENNVLVVFEKFHPEWGYKLPGGAAKRGENLGTAAIREVFEETGIECEFVGVVGWRHSHRTGYEAPSDVYFGCLLRPLSKKITIQESEVAQALWMPYGDFFKIAKNSCIEFLKAYEIQDKGLPCASVSPLLHYYAPVNDAI